MLVPWIAGATLDARRRGARRAGRGPGAPWAGWPWGWPSAPPSGCPALLEQRGGAGRTGAACPYLRFERSLWPFPLDLRWTYPLSRSGSGARPEASVRPDRPPRRRRRASGPGDPAPAGRRAGPGAGARTGPPVPGGAGGRSPASWWRRITWLLNGTWSRPVWEHRAPAGQRAVRLAPLGPFSLGGGGGRRVAVRRLRPAPGTGAGPWGGCSPASWPSTPSPCARPRPGPGRPRSSIPGGSQGQGGRGDDPGGAGGDDQHGGVPAPGGRLRRAPWRRTQGSREAYEAPLPRRGLDRRPGVAVPGDGAGAPGRGTPRRGRAAEVEVGGSGAGRGGLPHPRLSRGGAAYVDGRPAPRTGHRPWTARGPAGARLRRGRRPARRPHRRAGSGEHPLAASRPGRCWRSPAPPGRRCWPAGPSPRPESLSARCSPPVRLRAGRGLPARRRRAGGRCAPGGFPAADLPRAPRRSSSICPPRCSPARAGRRPPGWSRQTLNGQTRGMARLRAPRPASAPNWTVPHRAVFQVGLGVEPPPPGGSDERGVRFTVEVPIGGRRRPRAAARRGAAPPGAARRPGGGASSSSTWARRRAGDHARATGGRPARGTVRDGDRARRVGRPDGLRRPLRALPAVSTGDLPAFVPPPAPIGS